jgi:hypothetical protein
LFDFVVLAITVYSRSKQFKVQVGHKESRYTEPMGGETSIPEPEPNEAVDQPDKAHPRRRRLFRFIGFGLIAIAILLLVYGTVIDFAWQRGQSLRAENEQLAIQEQLASQMAYAEEDIKVGSYNLAIRRLDWILEHDSNYPGAESLRQVALNGDNTRPTLTPFPTATSPPVEEPRPEESEPARLFAELQQVIEDEDWKSVVTAVSAFQAQYPDFNRQQTDAMLYNAYINLGQLLLPGDQVELGLFYLAQAEKLGDLPLEVEDQRLWAELYLLGISYYGVDWSVAVYYFRDLCAAAPFYQDSCLKLQEALISFGDQFAANLDWCPAEGYYAEAVRQNNDPVTSGKLGEARRQCLEATPTPTIPITGTESISGILPTLIVDSRLASN